MVGKSKPSKESEGKKRERKREKKEITSYKENGVQYCICLS